MPLPPPLAASAAVAPWGHPTSVARDRKKREWPVFTTAPLTAARLTAPSKEPLTVYVRLSSRARGGALLSGVSSPAQLPTWQLAG